MPRKKSTLPSPDAGNDIKEVVTDAKVEAIISEAVAAEAEKEKESETEKGKANPKNFADDDIIATTDIFLTITNAKKYEAFQKNVEAAWEVITEYHFVGNGKILLRVETR